DTVCAQAVTLSPHSGECLRIRNKPINNYQTLKFLYNGLNLRLPGGAYAKTALILLFFAEHLILHDIII
ncbi:MAG: hypothetical protein WCI27_12085, partial [Candidatus Omnitrophota bacterium]